MTGACLLQIHICDQKTDITLEEVVMHKAIMLNWQLDINWAELWLNYYYV